MSSFPPGVRRRDRCNRSLAPCQSLRPTRRAGHVASLARPGANITGFSGIEYGMSAKWLELLKEIAPRVTRAAVLRDYAAPGQIAQLAAILAVAPSLRVELSPVGLERCSPR